MMQAIYSLPRYAQIKTYIKNQVESGQWKVGDRVPSENKLSQDFAVSRMTARRAVQELADEHLLIRSPGLGTFVAEPQAANALLEIDDFAQQFNHSNPQYSNRILSLEEVGAEKDMASVLGVNQGDPLFHSVMIHYRDSAAVQWEECFVNPGMAAAYLKQNYSKVTPQAYLNWVAPATRVEHQVLAVMPEIEVTGALGLAAISACLKVSRRSWSADKVVSVCKLIYPGSYSLGAELII
ncbi:MAG: UTRA domain-containing protein [Porticoccaceae bacterium]|nr:UTRA domain-containing protein [Porticoccaceae bacterium]